MAPDTIIKTKAWIEASLGVDGAAGRDYEKGGQESGSKAVVAGSGPDMHMNVPVTHAPVCTT